MTEGRTPERGRLIGPRGEVLLFFALLDFVFAYAVTNPIRPLVPQYVWLNSVLPLWVWGLWWLLTGVVCLVFAFLPVDTPAFTAAIAVKVGWGLLSGIGWLNGQDPRGYVSAIIWLGFAYFVFRVAGGIPPPADRGGRRWIRS